MSSQAPVAFHFALPEALAQGALPTTAHEMQQLLSSLALQVDAFVHDQVEQQVRQQVERQLDGRIWAQIKPQLDAYQARLDAQFDSRVASEVAARVQSILEQYRLARHHRFGASSEAGQRSLFNEAELLAGEPAVAEASHDEVSAAPSRAQGKACHKPRGHRCALPPELPRVEVVIDVPADQRRDATGAPMVRIGEEVSERLDITPMKIRVIRTIRPKYAPATGDAPPVVASLPPSILPHSQFTAGFAAMLLTLKYVDGLPLYRMAKVLARHGVDVPRQSLARTAIQTAQALQPIANLMRDALFEGDVLHMDETRVQVLKEPGRAATTQSYMWVSRGGPPGKPAVMFDYAPSRAGEVATRLLAGFDGYLMTDGYAGYDAAVAAHGLTHLACMAHARRKFVEAKRASPKGKDAHADRALVFFARLYRIEQRVRRAPDALRLRVRQKVSRQTLDALHAWLMDLLPKVAPKTKLGEALAYAVKLWPQLTRYTERGDLPIDNNACENAIRPFVVGRKAWMFSATPAGAHASALVYSLIETARANGRDPYAWLCHVLERLPLARTVDDIEALLPWNVRDQDLAANLVLREESPCV